MKMADEETESKRLGDKSIMETIEGYNKYDKDEKIQSENLYLISSGQLDISDCTDTSVGETEQFYTPRQYENSSSKTDGEITSLEFQSFMSTTDDSVISIEDFNETLKESSSGNITAQDIHMTKKESNRLIAEPVMSSSPVPSNSQVPQITVCQPEKEISSSQTETGSVENESDLSTEEGSTEMNWRDESETDLEDNVDNNEELHWTGAHTKDHRISDPELPDTVTKLVTPDGGKVYLVGTAHFSLESQEDVAKTIQATQPDIVMVELCKGRVNILQLDEKTILEEAKNLNLEKIRSAIKQSGFVQGIMYLLLLSMSAHLTKQLGMAPGGEFRRAFAEAKKVPGCLVHLGDRPIQITLQRALAALSWWQKLRLAWYMVTSKEPISKEEVERCKRRDLLEEMLAEMTGEFPALSQVFVKERDIYLTYSLQVAASSMAGMTRLGTKVSPAVVVGVVGIGHVPGIVANWGKVTEEDIPSLFKVPEASVLGKVLRYTFRASLFGLAFWGCYKLLPKDPSKFLPDITLLKPIRHA